MLRCIFVGSPNRFTELIVHWLSKHTDLQGVVWTSSAHWAQTFSGRLQFAKKRINRFGILKTVDEALYYALAKNVLKDTGESCQNRLWDMYVGEYGQPHWRGDMIETNDINSKEVLAFVHEHSPDLIMSMCINEFFRREIREIPRLGAFLWHEGIVPEYKGLYSPFWAVYNNELDMLGYTVLRMNGRYDEGEVFLQDRVIDVDPQTDSSPYIGHKAILDSLPGVARLFDDLENGSAQPMTIEGRASGCYTYPGLTDWIRYRMRIRELNKEKAKGTESQVSVAGESLQDRP